MQVEVVAAGAEHEHCVLCGRDTAIPKAADLNARSDYYEGCGQLCPVCCLMLQDDSRVTPGDVHGPRRTASSTEPVKPYRHYLRRVFAGKNQNCMAVF